MRKKIRWAAMPIVLVVLLVLAAPTALSAGKKKKDEAEAAPKKPNLLENLDYSKIVWPNPPAITRIKYLNYFCCEKFVPAAEKKKSSWMDRMAGGMTEQQKLAEKPLFALWNPYGLAVDSKSKVYVADAKVGAVFIFNTETKDIEMIKNGVHARFGDIVGLAIDDADRLFVSDTHFHRIMVFNAQHKAEGVISDGLIDPAGMAIDNENRFLYVADAGLDQVLVFDADKLNLIRKIGTAGKDHTLTGPGEFSKPTNVAVDQDGNLYVTDTYNNRVEIFDGDGNFIREFGKAGDRPGTFARPKGIAVDADGHIWVADAVQDRVQCFSQDGRLLIWMGGHGTLPGQFRALAGLYIDKNNRIFTSEQYPGRVQMFRYVTQAEARAEYQRRQAMEKKPSEGRPEAAANVSAATKTASGAKVQNESTAKTPNPAVQ